MPAPILVDTSAWIDHFRGKPSPAALHLASVLEQEVEIVVPGVVLAELLMGLPSDRAAGWMVLRFQAFQATPDLEWKDYEAAAALFRACRRRGYTVRGLVDCLIASLCIRYGYVLLTGDRDFQVLARFSSLQLTGDGELEAP